MVYCWILISVLLQAAVLSYVNFVYLPGRGSVRATMYEEEVPKVKDRSLKLPEDAKDVTVSFDGLYVAYRQDDSLVIANIDSRKTVKSLKPSGGRFAYFRWLPDREMLIYSISEPEGKKGRVRISTYDIGPELERSYPDIKGLPEGSEIIDIELSPLTNIVYPMIKTGKTKAKIYKFDIMDNLTFIMNTDVSTIIKETMYTDSLIYQTSDGGIRIRNGKSGKTSRLPVKEAKLLLAADDFDFIYAGAADENGRIMAIHYGKAGQKAEEWKTARPDTPVLAENVFITAEGAIYTADVQEKEVRAVGGTNATKYQGELLAVLDGYVVSKDGSRLVLNVLDK